MTTVQDLGGRIDAALASIEQRREEFRETETRKYEAYQQRVEKLNKVFDQLREVWRPPLETLIAKFGDKVKATPSLMPSTREITLDFQADVAKVQLRFRATADQDITKLILVYDLEMIPILMKFESHSELEMPLDAVDPDVVARWSDDRILSFVNTYVAAQENKYYLKDQMVKDPVTGTEFPKAAAGAKLEQGGQTYYFISEETKRAFEKRRQPT
jgi:YHS domain-containing protein